jgi:hypothetical protein
MTADHIGLAWLFNFGELLAAAAQRRKPCQPQKHGADEVSSIHGIPFRMTAIMNAYWSQRGPQRAAQPSLTVRSVANLATLQSEADVAWRSKLAAATAGDG